MNFFGTMVLCKNFFLMHMHLQDIFSKSPNPPPPPPSEVKWSAPKISRFKSFVSLSL